MSGSDSSVEVKVTADTSVLKSQLAEAQANVKSFAAAVDTLTQAAKTYGAQASIEAQLKKDQAALDEARAKVADLTAELKQVEAPATDAAASIDRIAPAANTAHTATAGVTREFIVLGHEAMSGNFSRIPGSLMVLAERSGNLRTMLASITPEIAGIGAAAIAAAAIFAEWAIQAAKVETAVRGAAIAAVEAGRSGPGARSQIEQSGQQIAAPGTLSAHDATLLAAAINQLGELTDDQKAKVTSLGAAFAAMFQGNIAETEKFIAETFKSEASLKTYLDRFHVLNTDGVRAWDQTTDAAKRFELGIQAITDRLAPAFDAYRKLNDEATIARANASLGGEAGVSLSPLAAPQGPSRGNIPDSAAALIDNTAKTLGLTQAVADFATRLAQIESGGKQIGGAGSIAGANEVTTSKTRALGMMQVEPDDRERGTTKTIAGQTLDLTDAAQNVKASLLMISESYKKHNGDLREVASDYVGRGTSPAATAERTKYLSNLGLSGGPSPFRPNMGEQEPGTTGDMSGERDQKKIDEYNKANEELSRLTDDRKAIFARQTADTAEAARASQAGDTAAFNAARRRIQEEEDALREIDAKKALIRTAFDKDTEKTTSRQIDTTKSTIAQTTPDHHEQAIKDAQAEEDAWNKAAQTVGITEGAKMDFEDKATRAHIAGLRAQTQADGTFMSQKEAALRAGEADEAESALRSGATHEQMRASELQFEKNYWEQVRASGTLTTEQQRQVEEKLSEVRRKVAEEAITANKTAQDKQLAATEARLAHEVQLAKGNIADIVAIEQQRVAAVAAVHGTESAEYFRALEQQTSAEKQAVDTQVRDIEQAMQRRITATTKALETEAAAGQISKVRMLQDLEAFETAQYSAALSGLQKIIDLNGLDVAARAEAIKQKEKLEEKFSNDMAGLRLKEQQAASASALQTTRAYEQAFSQIGSAGHSSVEGLITGQMTWLSAAQNVARAVLSSFLNVAEMELARWTATEVAKTASTETQAAVRTAQETSAGSGWPIILARWLGLEAAKTTATTAQVATRSAVENGPAATVAITKGVSTFVAGEVTKTAAATAGATTRTTVENGPAVVAGVAKNVAVYAAGEAAKTSATMTGVGARQAAENTGWFSQLIAKIVGFFVGGEVAKTAATVAGSTTRAATEGTEATASALAIGVATRLQIAAAAAEAAAWAFADSASLGPAGLAAAPAAALAAEGAVMAMQTLVPLATGAYDVGRGGAALLHPGEMVIPQTFASGLRSAVGAGSPTTNNSSPSINANYAPTFSGGGQSMSAHSSNQFKEFQAWVGSVVRNGNLAPPRYS